MTLRASGNSFLGKPSRSARRYETRQRATRQLVLPTSEAKDDIHLSVKEELTGTNTKDIERIKISSNKICDRENFAKEKMVFSKESSQVIFNMGNVELTELKKSTIQCPSCLHCVREGTFLGTCGKFLKLNPDAINRIKEALDILKAPFLASPISTSGAKCGQNPWQLHHSKARDAFRGVTKCER